MIDEKERDAENEEIARLAKIVSQRIAENPMLISAEEQHLKYLRDKHARELFLWQEGEAIGEKRGIAIGEKHGKAEAEKEFVKALLASGMSAEEIAIRLKRDITEIRSMLE